jgi:hypothetical protein
MSRLPDWASRNRTAVGPAEPLERRQGRLRAAVSDWSRVWDPHQQRWLTTDELAQSVDRCVTEILEMRPR